jgi:hypothetical protein
MISLSRFGLTLAVVALTSIVGISIPTTVSAQNMTGNMTNAQAPTLGEPFLIEKGKTTGQKEIGPIGHKSRTPPMEH